VSKRKFTVTVQAEIYRELSIYAAQNDINISDLARRIFDDFVKNHVKVDNSSVS
jgi:hypothetical protein